jgi:hypothetical protein
LNIHLVKEHKPLKFGEKDICAKIEEGGHDQHHESSIDIDCVLFS